MKTQTLLLPIVLSLTLSACGNKGPLFLPEDPPPDDATAQTPAAIDAGAEADPLPADSNTPPLPPASPPTEPLPEPVPEPEPPPAADADGDG